MTSREVGSGGVIRESDGSLRRPPSRPARPATPWEDRRLPIWYIPQLLVARAIVAEVLQNRHDHRVLDGILPAQDRRRHEAIALPRFQDPPRCHELIDERDHQPVGGIVVLVDDTGKFVSGFRQLGERAATNVEHVDTAIGQDQGQQVAVAVHQPYGEFRGKEPLPAREQACPVVPAVVDQVAQSWTFIGLP